MNTFHRAPDLSIELTDDFASTSVSGNAPGSLKKNKKKKGKVGNPSGRPITAKSPRLSPMSK